MKKNTHFLSSIFFILFFGVFCLSCTEDCPEGYSGKDCEISVSDRFLGSFTGYQNCGAGNGAVTIEIKRDKGPRDVLVDFIATPDFVLHASAYGDTLIFQEQVLTIPGTTDTSYFIIFDSFGVLHQDTFDFDITILPVASQQKINCIYSVVK